MRGSDQKEINTGRGKHLLSSMFGHGYIVLFSVAFGTTHPEGKMGHFSALKDLECKCVSLEVCVVLTSFQPVSL